jgi:3-hydroxyisobutyrate dehydrogenase
MSASSGAERASVGFIGLGAMGAPMSARIAAGGFPLTIYDIDGKRASEIASTLRAKAAGSPAEAAAGADVLITMLPTSAVVAEALAGKDGALSRLKPGAVVVEMSSGVPALTVEIAKRVAGSGGLLIDAPVSGGVSKARTGELAIMVGGEDAAFAVAEPVLKTMGASILRVGGIGAAHAMKALNNLVSAGGFLIGVEALLIGARFGLDPEVMVDVLNASTGMNNSTQKKFKQFVLSRAFNAGFGLDLMVKDLGIALSVAKDTDTTAPFASLCRELWAGAQKTLGPGQDHTAVARFSEMMAGSELTKT